MHVIEILGEMGFVKEGSDLKKITIITDDCLALIFIFDKEASFMTSSSNVIIDLVLFLLVVDFYSYYTLLVRYVYLYKIYTIKLLLFEFNTRLFQIHCVTYTK